VRGHVAIITETESTYVMIESTLQFDDVEDIPGLLPLLRAVQKSHMRSKEWSGRRPGHEANSREVEHAFQKVLITARHKGAQTYGRCCDINLMT